MVFQFESAEDSRALQAERVKKDVISNVAEVVLIDKNNVELGLQYAIDNRKAEIAFLWSRSLYFWGLIAVLLGAYGASFQSGHKTLAVFAGCFGTLCSLSWSLANRSSKYWQEVWEKKVEQWEQLAIERGVLLHPLFPHETNPSIDERWFWGAKRYSPSKLVIAISDYSVIGWVMLVIGAIVSRFVQESPGFQVVAAWAGNIIALILTVLGCVTLMLWCRSGSAVGLKLAWTVAKGLPRRMTLWLTGLISN